MLDFLRGRVVRAAPHQVLLEVGPFGVVVRVPLSVSRALTPDSEATLLTVLLLPREEGEPLLYGFLTEEERRLFLLLKGVSGVGAQKALALLSHFSPTQLIQLIQTGNPQALTTVKGIGKKLAQQILLDLGPALAKLPQATLPPAYNDAYQALLALGFPSAEAHARLEGAFRQAPEADAETLVQLALKNT